MFGLHTVGAGALWDDDFTLEQVPPSVPIAGQFQPENLTFTEKSQ